VREAVDVGQLVFGESKVQGSSRQNPFVYHRTFAGIYRSSSEEQNPSCAPLFEMIHSVDSLELAQAIDRIAHEDDCIRESSWK